MPGKKITDEQVRKYKEARRRATQQIASARMGISVRSARRIEKADGLPSQSGARKWRTRLDPLAGVWAEELVPLLETEPGLQGRMLLEELQRRHGDIFGDGLLRTLQRRIRAWRVEHGHEKEVFFAQANPPGRLALSDFTVCNELAVSIAGELFAHRLYQFALAYSGWRHAEVVRAGESFAALAQGLQNALWSLAVVSSSRSVFSELPVRQWSNGACYPGIHSISELPVRQWSQTVGDARPSFFSELPVRQWSEAR